MIERQLFFLLFLAAPFGISFILLAGVWLIGWTPRERVLVKLTQVSSLLSLVGGFDLLPALQSPATLQLGDWFRVGKDYSFPISARLDEYSLPIALLTTFLVGLVASFSRRYLHRDAGFFRFFLLMNLFGFGAQLVALSGSFDLLIGGWELVGLSSVLLIGYFRDREGPVDSGLRVFANYRACDIGLLVGVFALHHFAGDATFDVLDRPFSMAWVPAALLLLGAMGKSAQAPFSGWLPLAMEGPTPSSAIFYGAISVHLGAYLLLRSRPLLDQAPGVATLVVLVGLVSAFHGTLVGRASADAKSSIAYASLTQLGLIFVEIGLGFPHLATWHIVGHSLVRTLQFLRAPSMLREHHQMFAAAGGQLEPTGKVYEGILPLSVQRWLYRWAVDRDHFHHLLARFVLRPLLLAGHLLYRIETRVAAPVPAPLPAPDARLTRIPAKLPREAQ